MTDRKNVLNGVQTVVLDLDGTLYDKRGLARRMVRHLWWCLPLLLAERMARKEMHKVQYSSEQEFFDAFFAEMARGHWWSPDRAARWYHKVYLPVMIRLIARYHAPRPEVMALIDMCKERGVRMAIYSDYGCVEQKLSALGIDASPFELMVSAPELGALKPSEPCARQVLERLHADPKTTLFVGDRDEKDGASARSVGARFLLVENK